MKHLRRKLDPQIMWNTCLEWERACNDLSCIRQSMKSSAGTIYIQYFVRIMWISCRTSEQHTGAACPHVAPECLLLVPTVIFNPHWIRSQPLRQVYLIWPMNCLNRNWLPTGSAIRKPVVVAYRIMYHKSHVLLFSFGFSRIRSD